MFTTISLKKNPTTAMVFVVLSSMSASAFAAQTLRLAHASSTDSLVNQAVTRFADEVNKTTQGSLTVKIYPGEQLGDETAIADGVGNGSIDIGLGGAVDAIDPRLNALSLPFLFKNAPAVHHYLDSPAGKKLLSIGQDRGFQMLGALDSGFRQFADTKRPIRTPDDMKGLKVRTPPNPVIIATIKQLGGLPQSLPFGSVYTSLQSGVVDGIEPELRDYYDQKWYEVAKYVGISNYIWTPNFWYMNREKYNGLSSSERAAVDKAVADTVAWYRQQLDQTYATVTTQLKAKGVKFNDVDPTPFRQKVDAVYTQFSNTWGAAFVSSLRSAANGQ
jgi:tripartite ATP-independent transporter DctP family solute receptor